MGVMVSEPAVRPLKALVAIASYGSGNDAYLERIIREYRAMDLAVDIVILSNIEKGPAFGVECRIGTPTRNPWSLPFAHKKLFAERRDAYDLFIYTEDDIFLTERNLRAWLEVNAALREDEIAGFLRVEHGADGALSYPDAHAWFHWDCESVRRRGAHTLAFFTNEHAACYILTRAQLERALRSNGFDVPPHEGKYDLLCTAATDVYTQCGMKKLIPISHIADFRVHHMSNRYVGKMGVTEDVFLRQIDALMRIADGAVSTRSLLPTETRLWRAEYSKDYYEPACAEVTKLVPADAQSVLSIGCGSGETEIRLVEQGRRVAALPLDHAIAAGAAAKGVELIDVDLHSAAKGLAGRKFDALLMLNVLHLAPDPVEVLRSLAALLTKDAPIIVRSPNMSGLHAAWRHVRERRAGRPRGFSVSGAHLTSRRSLDQWCAKAGLIVFNAFEILDTRLAAYDTRIPKIARGALATEIVAVVGRPSVRRRGETHRNWT